MNTNIVAKVTAEGKLEIPPEVLVRLQPCTEYEVLVTEDEIVFKKISKQLNWAELPSHFLYYLANFFKSRLIGVRA